MNKKIVKICPISGKIITIYNSIDDIEENKRKDVLKICENKQLYINGFTWDFYDSVKNLTDVDLKDFIYKKCNVLLQLNQQGNIIKVWRNAKEASNALHISQGNISSVCLGKRRLAYNHQWMYYNDYVLIKNKELRQIKTTAKKIKQYSLNGDFIKEFSSIIEASKELNISDTKISLVCKGKRYQTGGYFWQYSDNPLNDDILKKIKNKEIKFNYFSEKNSLEALYPNIAKRWDYSKNGDIKPNMIASHCGKKYFFLCNFGHSFETRVSHMVDAKIDCPICNAKNKISFPEKVLYYYLKDYFVDIELQKNFNFLGNKSLDLYIPSLKIGIEYDGQAWHKDMKKDLIKNDLCNQNQIVLYRIREPLCPILNSCSVDFILEDLSFYALEYQLKNLLKQLNVNKIIKDIDITKYRDDIIKTYSEKFNS